MLRELYTDIESGRNRACHWWGSRAFPVVTARVCGPATLKGAPHIAACFNAPFIAILLFLAVRAALTGIGSIHLAVPGGVAIFAMHVAPGRISGPIQPRTGWDLFPSRRRL